METASPDDSISELLLKSSSERSDLYTSLLSSHSSTNPFSSNVPLFSSDPSPVVRPGSDSGIGMTPGDPFDLQTQKNEPYNYMDMSNNLSDFGDLGNHGKQPIKSHGDEDHDSDDDEDGSLDSKLKKEKEPFDLGHYLEKNPETLEVKGSMNNTFPYVEDQSDDDLADYYPHGRMGTVRTASPVKITVTTEAYSPLTEEPRGGVSERESVLSLGKEGVPTVTLSEPEDDSAASSVNHSPNHSPTGRESPSDLFFQPVGIKNVNCSAPYQDTKLPTKPFSGFAMHDRDSGESGDSEIEPDSPRREKHLSAHDRFGNPFEPFANMKAGLEINQRSKENLSNPFEASLNKKSDLVQSGNPPLYSLLREEREAELDSDLLVESASEESPKREQILKSTLQPTTPPPPSNPVTTKKEKEERKEKPSTAPFENAMVKPLQEDNLFTKPRPEVVGSSATSSEQHPIEDKEKNSKVISNDRSLGTKEAELLLFFKTFNKKKVVDLLHWRDVKQSAVLFGSMLVLLFSLTQFSVVSVIAYVALAALSTTISFRVYKSVLQAVQKNDDGHPFKTYLEMEIALSPEQITKYVEKVQLYVNYTLKELRRLFLVQDIIDSIKFAVLMWLLTYVGALFNGLTLLILAVVSMFTAPLVYEKYQKQIDQYLGLMRSQVNSIMTKLREKVPGAKRKEE
ncbi:reticulon-1a isoform X1 [Trichomycterus rosablanca]|uniref:reticulon-1a isoform X1 n=1 Tax=Trichomycterus rosablanca TaxID=2290929 RepID=UPI002F34F210